MSGHSQYNVELIVGLTGSGKSTFAAGRAFDRAVRTGQHVYTNMGVSIDGLRHHYLRRYGARYRRPMPAFHRMWHHLGEDQVPRFWEHVPPDSLIIIDEAQVYFPQRGLKGDDSPDLVQYLTQHRKLRHNLWFLTQYPTLVSHSVRKVNHLFWQVQNVRQRAIDFVFFQFHIPVDGFFYTCRYRDEKGDKVDGQTILAGLPWNRWVWDLFESRSLHGGLDNLRARGASGKSMPVFRGVRHAVTEAA